MPRSLRDSKLDTREQRLRLKVRGKPYWRQIETASITSSGPLGITTPIGTAR